MSEQTPETTPDQPTDPDAPDQAPEQDAPPAAPSVKVGDVVTYQQADAYGNTHDALGLVLELFEDSRQQLDGTWTEPELYARLGQLPDAGTYPVTSLNQD